MIYLITNCTNAKKIPAEEQLQLGNYDFTNIDKTLINWNKILFDNSSKKTMANKLYKGVGWKAALDTKINFLKKFNTELLVSSAGYGLIKECDEIAPYAVTFAKGHNDSVHNFSINMATSLWWNSINKFDLNKLDKDASIFIVLPSEYLISMKDTIDELISIFGNKVFIIVVAKRELPKSFEKNILRFDTRFNSYQQGTLTSIIQRCMKWLSNEIVINDLEINHQILQTYIDIFLSKQTKYEVEKRIQCTDEKIVELISNHILKDEIKSASKGLKKLRSIGYACEQKRYGQLFKKTYTGIKNNG